MRSEDRASEKEAVDAKRRNSVSSEIDAGVSDFYGLQGLAVSGRGAKDESDNEDKQGATL